jgi:hypothetical protein
MARVRSGQAHAPWASWITAAIRPLAPAGHGLGDGSLKRGSRTFVMGVSDHPSHAVLARQLQGYLRWRNANARRPDILAAQRRERARVRSEREQRWGRPRPKAA